MSEEITKIVERTLGSKDRTVHHIKISDGEPRGGWYRQVTALSGMLHRSLNRWCEHWYHSPKRYEVYRSLTRFDRYSVMDAHRESEEASYREIKDIHHESLWAFFDFIGYDHKDKRVSNTDKHLILIKKR